MKTIDKDVRVVNDLTTQSKIAIIGGEYGYFSNSSKTILPDEKLPIKEGQRVKIIIVYEDD